MTTVCSSHEEKRRKLIRNTLIGVAVILTLIIVIIVLVWVILRHTKPTFTLQDATLYAFNVSVYTTVPNTLSIMMQVTLSSHNPNFGGIYYQNLDAYASYHGEQVTMGTPLPDTYLGRKDLAVWSPSLFGNAAPLPPYAVSSLQQECEGGVTVVNVKVSGWVKWKVGPWTSGWHHLSVNCPAYIRVGDDGGSGGLMVVSPAVKFQLLQPCSVDD